MLKRLVGLLHSSGTGKYSEKTAKLAALSLSNISIAPAAKSYFLPYERDLFMVAATDPGISSIICNILSDLDSISCLDDSIL